MKDFAPYKLNILFDKDGDSGGGDPADPPGDPNPKDPPEDPKGDPKDPPKMVPYDRFKEVNDRLKGLEAAEAERIETAKKAKQKKLEEDNEFKKLYEDTLNEYESFKKENLRVKIAYKKGLPEEAINRMVGETEEELEEDADKLLEILNVNKSNNGIPPRNRHGTPKVTDYKNMTPEEIRKNKHEIISGFRE